LTRELIDNGTIHFDDSIDLVPKDFFVENTLVIITLLFLAHIQSGIILWSENTNKKRAEVLGIITKDTFVLLSERTGKQQPLVF
jgi:UDP-N-acetylmuramate--alanine ligase